MNLQQFSNNTRTTIAGAINDSVLSLDVAAGTGTLFPTLGAGEYFLATLVDNIRFPTKVEVIKVTNVTTDTLTIVRNQEAIPGFSPPYAFDDLAIIDVRLTAGGLDRLATPTLDDVKIEPELTIGDPVLIDNWRLMFNHHYSAGIMDGGTITNNGDGTVNIAESSGTLRAVADDHTDIYNVVIPAQSNITLTDNTTNYIFADFNGGSPQWDVGLTIDAFNCQNKCIGYIVVRIGTVLKILDVKEQNVDSNRKHRRKELDTQRFEHVLGGSLLSSSGLDLLVTEGAFWFGLDRTDHPALNTTGADVFTYAYTTTTGATWTRNNSASLIDNTQYNTVASGLTTLANNKFKVDWVYTVTDTPSYFVVVYGQDEYADFSTASAALAPAYLPPEVTGLGALIGKVIVQKSASTMTTLGLLDTAVFATTANSHEGLSNLLSAGAGVTYGHVNDQAQTIAGTKTFSSKTNHTQVGWSKGANIASASALPVLTDGNYFTVTGTTNITSINTTGKVGTMIKLHFEGALTITHHATDLILPDGLNITTVAGDQLEFTEYASGDYRLTGGLLANRVLNQSIKFNPQVGTTYTFVESDNGKVVTLSNASPITLTCPNGLSSGWNASYKQQGAGQVTATATTTLQSEGNKYKTIGQHSMVTVLHEGSDVFTIAGGLVA